MSLSSTAAHCSASENACRISPGQVNQVRPKLPLLKILQAAGAQGEMFTMKEVMHYLGQYIMVKQLYDQQEQHMVYCGGDLLGELLGLQSFSVKDPSPLYDMLRKNLVTATVTDAAQTLAIAQDQSMDIPSRDQLKQGAEGSSSPGYGLEEGDSPALSTSQRKSRNPRSDEDLIENLTPNKSPRLDLVFEEWDVAGLPWWFLGNLRNNYTPRSNGSTDLQTNQDIDTAIVSDTTDDLWFLNESGPEQLNVAVKVEAADTEQASEGGKEADKKGEWQCTKCKKFNSPSKRYCFRCWALRKDWYSDCPKLSHSLSVSNIPAMPVKKDDQGIDVPDCRRTISDPLVRPKEPYKMEEKSKLLDSCNSVEFLDLAQSSESQETISSIGEQPENLYEQNTDTAAMENCKNLFKPCKLCEKRPRDGNIIHGRTAHLVACFRCAKRLKKTRAPCPICKKSIQMVIKIFVA
ncbi:protein Mdm4 isoform X3 [Trichosurus vulpecula]|uniref:protein Mdm4 isoform X3 n=1 Tax=Trichosurus vulpecula TaxID=9337 RepID=UPI00186AFED4|nr:protein Mdm4 isoform X3 [Trichosurus vulpecula]